jgi:peptidoglycan/LPS O-acetylase OafA/YrhL
MAHEPWPLKWAAFFATSIGSSALLYHLVEAPLIAFGAAVVERRNNALPAADIAGA